MSQTRFSLLGFSSLAAGALFVACGAEDDWSAAEADVTGSGTLAIPSYVDGADAVCPADHPTRKIDDSGPANMHDRCCDGTWCMYGLSSGCPGEGEYVLTPGNDRCVEPVAAMHYFYAGEGQCPKGKIKIDPALAAATTPVIDPTMHVRDVCKDGSTPTCDPGEVLAPIEGRDECVRAVPSEAFVEVAPGSCPAGTERVLDVRYSTLDVCCYPGGQMMYPGMCQPLLTARDACPDGSRLISRLGADACLTPR